MKERVIIDCDTGIDDALALVLALSRPELDIVGITTVAGNVDVENTTRNTCNVVHLLGRDDIRIAKGEPKPLEREPLRASGVHGVTGLRGYTFDSDWKENRQHHPRLWNHEDRRRREDRHGQRGGHLREQA